MIYRRRRRGEKKQSKDCTKMEEFFVIICLRFILKATQKQKLNSIDSALLIVLTGVAHVFDVMN